MPSHLLISKDKFRSDIALQIAEGQAILKQYNKTQNPGEDFRKLYRAYEQWDSYNQSWLEHSFSGERNSYEVGYENAGAWNTERMNAVQRMDPSSLDFKFRFFESYITPKIEFLEDLQAKSVLLPVRLPMPESQSPLSESALTPTPPHQPAPIPTRSKEVEKIFISHSSKDAALVEEIIELLEVMGIKAEQIFCSSFEGYSIDLGQDFLQRIKDELNSNVLVLFVLTSNFYNSPVSLCEMGAAWVRTSKHIPVVVPPLSYDDIKGVIPLTQGFKINEAKKWNVLKGQLEQWFELQPIPLPVWERKRDRGIQIIDEKIVRATSKPAQDPLVPKPKGDSDLSHFGGINV